MQKGHIVMVLVMVVGLKYSVMDMCGVYADSL